MVIGIVGLGMLLGMFGGAAALFTGQSVLTALGLYVAVGTLSTLTIAVILYASSGVQSYIFNAPGRRSFQ